MVLHASVIDKNGKLLTNIPQSAFKVFENGVEQPIKLFRREDVPVSMGIIIDNSGSMRDKRPKVAAASMAAGEGVRIRRTKCSSSTSTTTRIWIRPFTNDTKKLEEALDKIDASGGTAMRDAISMSIDYVKEQRQEGEESAAGGDRRQRQHQQRYRWSNWCARRSRARC